MNQVALPTTTMSSREIAELTGKRHGDVLRDIRVMLIELYAEEYVQKNAPDQNRAKFIRENADQIFTCVSNINSIGGMTTFGVINGIKGFDWSRDDRGYIESFSLDKSHSMTLVAGYSVKLRKRIIDRWQELEAGAAPVLNLRDPLQIAAAAMQLIEINNELQGKVEAMQTTVNAHELLTKADGAMCIQLAAKTLQIRPKELFSWLHAHRWIYRRPGSGTWAAYQDKQISGLMVHKATVIQRDDGTEKTLTQALVTARGLARLALVFGNDGQAALGAA